MIETPATFAQMIENSQEQIRSAQRALEVAGPACSNDGDRKIVVMNHCFLADAGRLSVNEHLKLLAACVKENDFTELAEKFYQHQRKQTETELSNPSLPLRGNDYEPGRENLETELLFIDAKMRGVKSVKEKGRGNPIWNIGSPSLRHIPDWFLMMEQEGMTLDELFEHVAKKTPDKHPHTTPAIEQIEHQVQNDVRRVA